MSSVVKMLSSLVLGDYNAKIIRKHRARVEKINALEPSISALSDDELAGKTQEFKSRIASGETLDDLLPEAFAVAREGAKRAIGLRLYDVQLIGGMVLHEGNIAEMKTGEGKTLVEVAPAYLNALSGNGVHIVTVNDYLSRRDSEWMGQVFRFLGLTVGLIEHDLEAPERRAAYGADITYGTNNELGFDYLRDNMVMQVAEMVHRGFNFAIVDEVDSILVDEARTPLIISGPGEQSPDLYYRFADIVRHFVEGVDYHVDEKAKVATPTEGGISKVEKALGVDNLYGNADMDLSHYLTQALKAHALMHIDQDYVVKDGEVIIVDEFTGRLMFGRRYSNGLHQAIEAKEGVEIAQESTTLATITFQNFFRMYKKLAGMTGTAVTEEEEFRKIYGLDVIVIPPNRPIARQDLPDVVYKSGDAKFNAVVEEIVARHATGQPVLVGTVSIDKSEMLSRLLEKRGIPHQVLNAKYHEQEAQIIAKAGQKGAVTIATNMAGRGTDITLGEGVSELGGLHIIGTERHESRRIDNQLRGRAGRQGDPGSSRFYLSLDDDLMRIFGSDNIRGMMDKLGLEEDQPIEHSLLTKGIENAQRRVEARNFDARKNVLEYDDVMNKQREVIYDQRTRILNGENLQDVVREMIDTVIASDVDAFCSEGVRPEEWNLQGLIEQAETLFLEPEQLAVNDLEDMGKEAIRHVLQEKAHENYEAREAIFGAEIMREFERMIMLRVVDQKWVDHLTDMEDLREGIGLRAYGQRDPLIEYKREAYDMFQNMIASIQEDMVRFLFKTSIEIEDAAPEGEQMMMPGMFDLEGDGFLQPISMEDLAMLQGIPIKIGRNDPCPCGSGKKFKKCHGQMAE